MNPFTSVETGSQVIVTKIVEHTRSTIAKNQVGKLFIVYELEWDGRTHNRYVSSVYIRDKAGNSYRAIVDQLASVNPNYEPLGELIVCTSCGVTLYENELKKTRGLNMCQCPYCGAVDPANS